MSARLSGRAERREALGGLLERAAPRVKSSGPESWRLSLANGSRLSAEARLEGPWLSLEAPLRSRRRARDPRELLGANARLEGGVRFSLPGGGRSVSLRADLPLSPSEGLEARLRAGLRGLLEGAAFWRFRKRGTGEALPAEPQDSDECGPGLADLCEEAGWGSRGLEGGARRVDLDSQRGVYHADIRAVAGGGASAAAELARLPSPGPSSRLAVAVLLLAAGGAVRLARPALRESVEETVAVAEVSLIPPLRAEALDRALGALSTLGWLCGPELAALAAPALADAYLEARGWSPRLD
jgi:hypothetical protein